MEAKKTTVKVLQPSFYSEFKCDGKACGAACCKQWTIDVDAMTKKKYESIKLKALKESLRKNIVAVDVGGEKKTVMKLKHDGSCPFLMDNNLCKIQRICGEEFLSDTCKSYPRRVDYLGDYCVRTLVISCPVAARLTLLQSGPLRLEIADAKPAALLNVNAVKRENAAAVNILREPALSILQKQEYGLNERLILLGAFLDRAGEMLANGQAEEIPACGAVYLSEAFAPQAQELFSLCVADEREYIRYMLEIMEAFYGEGHRVYEHQSPQEFIEEVSEAYGISTGDNSISRIAEVYFASYGAYGRQLYEEYAQIWENFFAYQYLSKDQPYFFAEAMNINFGYFLTVCKFTEFLALASLTLHKEKFTAQSLIDIMSYVEQKIAHNSPSREAIREILKKKDKDILALMQLLIARL